MSGEALIVAATTGAFVIVYLVFKALFKNAESSDKRDVPDTFKNEIHIRNKESVTNRIDYWINNGDYNEALKLCNMYNEYNEPDDDINKRIRYIRKLNLS